MDAITPAAIISAMKTHISILWLVAAAGLGAQTLPTPLARSLMSSEVSTTSSPNKIPRLDSTGKFDLSLIPTDSLQIQLRKGTDAERQTVVFADGEPVWTTDTKSLYVGDGVTLGGVNPFLLTYVTPQIVYGRAANYANDYSGTSGYSDWLLQGKALVATSALTVAPASVLTDGATWPIDDGVVAASAQVGAPGVGAIDIQARRDSAFQTAWGVGAIALGNNNRAGDGAIAVGVVNWAEGGGLAVGGQNTVLGEGSTAIGQLNRVNGGIAIGGGNWAYGGVAIGNGALQLGPVRGGVAINPSVFGGGNAIQRTGGAVFVGPGQDMRSIVAAVASVSGLSVTFAFTGDSGQGFLKVFSVGDYVLGYDTNDRASTGNPITDEPNPGTEGSAFPLVFVSPIWGGIANGGDVGMVVTALTDTSLTATCPSTEMAAWFSERVGLGNMLVLWREFDAPAALIRSADYGSHSRISLSAATSGSSLTRYVATSASSSANTLAGLSARYRMKLSPGDCWAFDLVMVGTRNDGSNEAVVTMRRAGTIKRSLAGTTSLVGSVQTIGTDAADSALAGASITITADVTYACLAVAVTQPNTAGMQVRWVGEIRFTEIRRDNY